MKLITSTTAEKLRGGFYTPKPIAPRRARRA